MTRAVVGPAAPVDLTVEEAHPVQVKAGEELTALRRIALTSLGHLGFSAWVSRPGVIQREVCREHRSDLTRKSFRHDCWERISG